MHSENYHELLKLDVVKGAKSVFSKGLVQHGEGNVSTRIPNTDEFYITPTLNNYETITIQDVVHLKFDGTQLSEGKQASSEYRLHAALYKLRPRATCVIHTHSPYTSILSVLRKGIPVLLEEMVIFLGGSVPISDFGRANTDEIADTALKSLGTKNAVIMANHGMVACGRTMEQTVKTVEMVEKMAFIYWGALQMGKPFSIEESACGQFRNKFDENFATHNQDHVECE